MNATWSALDYNQAQKTARQRQELLNKTFQGDSPNRAPFLTTSKFEAGKNDASRD